MVKKKDQKGKERKSLWRHVDMKKMGRPVAFESPADMWAQACEYFQWVEDNPIMSEKLFNGALGLTRGEVTLKRPMTIKAFCIHANIGHSTFHDYCQKDDFSEVTKQINDIIYTQKFDGASAGQFNANIIARDLGLADINKSEVTGKDGGSIKTENSWTVEFINANPENK